MPIPINEGLINYQQGKGEAYIASGLDTTMMREKLRLGEQSQARLARALTNQKNKRKEDINELLENDIAIPDERDQGAINDALNELNKYIVDNGDNEDIFNRTTETYRKYKDLKRKAEVGATQSNRDQSEFATATNAISKLPSTSMIDKGAYADAWHTYYFGVDGNKNVFSGNKGVRPKEADYLNEGLWINKFVEDQVEEFTGTTSNLIPGKKGDFLESRTVTGKFYKLDSETGKVEIDSKGVPIIEVSDNTANAALQDAAWRGYIDGQIEKNPDHKGKTPEELTKEKLATRAYKNEVSKMGKGFGTKTGAGKKREMTPNDRNQSEAKVFSGDPSALVGGKFGADIITRAEFKKGKIILYGNKTIGGEVVESELGKIDRQDKETVTSIFNTKPGFGKFTRPELERETQFPVTEPPVRSWTPEDETNLNLIIKEPSSRKNLDMIEESEEVFSVTYDAGKPAIFGGWPSIDIEYEDDREVEQINPTTEEGKQRLKELYSQAKGIEEAAPTSKTPAKAPTETPSGKMRVRRKSDGKTGLIDESDFNDSKYERIQ